ncbi:MAG: hypothetical protein H6710_09740 [Myxococcales bacterium]|nr:hypothetical protein [Myxococcales bacterium]
MKVLFVGDGKHDVGLPDGPHRGDPWPARGVVPALARQVVPMIADDSLALAWKDLHRWRPTPGSGRPRGYAAKIKLAALLARRKLGCEAVIAVADRDGEPTRPDELAAAADEPHPVPTVCGVAIESIEAWTLGATTALAERLGLPLGNIKKKLPKPVETLYQSSGKREHRPKDLIAAIAELAHQRDSLELREAVAEQTDLQELERTCPEGFGRFAADLRRRFPTPD